MIIDMNGVVPNNFKFAKVSTIGKAEDMTAQ